MKPTSAGERPLSELIHLDRGIIQVLTEYEEHRLRESIQNEKNLFTLNAEFLLADFETAIKGLNTTIKKRGEIICTLRCKRREWDRIYRCCRHEGRP